MVDLTGRRISERGSRPIRTGESGGTGRRARFRIWWLSRGGSNPPSRIKGEQGEYGMWECLLHPQASRWLTFDLLWTLSNLSESTDWISKEPRTPFQPYPKKIKRY